jgi:hypothetical protein
MTLQETKIDILSRGIFINEGRIPKGNITVSMVKFDTDGLRLEADFELDVATFINDTVVSSILKEKAAIIENFASKRHAQDINSCEHQPVLIGNRKACANCMGNFGDRIILDINKN